MNGFNTFEIQIFIYAIEARAKNPRDLIRLEMKIKDCIFACRLVSNKVGLRAQPSSGNAECFCACVRAKCKSNHNTDERSMDTRQLKSY